MTGELIELNTTGDTRLIWTVGNRAEEEAARTHFEALKAKGYLAYKVVGEDGGRGEVVRRFDAEAGKIIMGPPMQGG